MQALESMLREWSQCAVGALDEMRADIEAGKISVENMERRFDFIRHLMGRLRILQDDVMRHNGSRPYRAGDRQ